MLVNSVINIIQFFLLTSISHSCYSSIMNLRNSCLAETRIGTQTAISVFPQDGLQKLKKTNLRHMHIKKILASIALVILALFAATATQAQIYSNAVIALNPDAYWPLQETVQPPLNYIATNSGTLGPLGINGYYETWWTVTNSAAAFNTVFTQ